MEHTHSQVRNLAQGPVSRFLIRGPVLLYRKAPIPYLNPYLSIPLRTRAPVCLYVRTRGHSEQKKERLYVRCYQTKRATTEYERYIMQRVSHTVVHPCNVVRAHTLPQQPLLRVEDAATAQCCCAACCGLPSLFFSPDPEWETPFSFLLCQDDGFTNF